MLWQELEPYDDPKVSFDADLFGFYQRLIAIRATQPALRLGAFHTVLTDDARGVLAFERVLGAEQVLVVSNRSAAQRTVV